MSPGRTVRRQVQGGHGHAGHNGLYEASLGLGAASVVKRLAVRWPGPGDRTSVFEDVPADRGWLVVEEASGNGRLVSLGPD